MAGEVVKAVETLVGPEILEGAAAAVTAFAPEVALPVDAIVGAVASAGVARDILDGRFHPNADDASREIKRRKTTNAPRAENDVNNVMQLRAMADPIQISRWRGLLEPFSELALSADDIVRVFETTNNAGVLPQLAEILTRGNTEDSRRIISVLASDSVTNHLALRSLRNMTTAPDSPLSAYLVALGNSHTPAREIERRWKEYRATIPAGARNVSPRKSGRTQIKRLQNNLKNNDFSNDSASRRIQQDTLDFLMNPTHEPIQESKDEDEKVPGVSGDLDGTRNALDHPMSDDAMTTTGHQRVFDSAYGHGNHGAAYPARESGSHTRTHAQSDVHAVANQLMSYGNFGGEVVDGQLRADRSGDGRTVPQEDGKPRPQFIDTEGTTQSTVQHSFARSSFSDGTSPLDEHDVWLQSASTPSRSDLRAITNDLDELIRAQELVREHEPWSMEYYDEMITRFNSRHPGYELDATTTIDFVRQLKKTPTPVRESAIPDEPVYRLLADLLPSPAEAPRAVQAAHNRGWSWRRLLEFFAAGGTIASLVAGAVTATGGGVGIGSGGTSTGGGGGGGGVAIGSGSGTVQARPVDASQPPVRDAGLEPEVRDFLHEMRNDDEALASFRPYLNSAGALEVVQDEDDDDDLIRMHFEMDIGKPANWPHGNVDNPLWVSSKVNEGMQAQFGYEIMPPVYPGGTINHGAVPAGTRRKVPTKADMAGHLTWNQIENTGFGPTKHRLRIPRNL